MKKSQLLLSGVAVIVLLGIGAFAYSQKTTKSDLMINKNDVMMPKDEPTELTNTTIQETEDKMMGDKVSESGYVQYSKSSFEKAAANRRILFFYASWCPTCKSTDENLSQNISKIPEDVTIVRVNYNDPSTDQDEKDLAKKYGITYQHTFVQIDNDGNELAKWNGGQIDELLSNVK